MTEGKAWLNSVCTRKVHGRSTSMNDFSPERAWLWFIAFVLVVYFLESCGV